MRLRTLRRHPLGRTVRHLDIQNCVQCVVVVRHLHGQPCQVEVVLYIVLVDLREACANVSLTTHIAAFRELCSCHPKQPWDRTDRRAQSRAMLERAAARWRPWALEGACTARRARAATTSQKNSLPLSEQNH